MINFVSLNNFYRNCWRYFSLLPSHGSKKNKLELSMFIITQPSRNSIFCTPLFISVFPQIIPIRDDGLVLLPTQSFPTLRKTFSLISNMTVGTKAFLLQRGKSVTMKALYSCGIIPVNYCFLCHKNYLFQCCKRKRNETKENVFISPHFIRELTILKSPKSN